MHTLVIDDKLSERQLLANLLAQLGHRVTQATSAREGLWLLEAADYDLVCTDLFMPEMDGWVVAGNIRERWPRVRVLLMTESKSAMEFGSVTAELADAVISKPFATDEIITTLQRIMHLPL